MSTLHTRRPRPFPVLSFLLVLAWTACSAHVPVARSDDDATQVRTPQTPPVAPPATPTNGLWPALPAGRDVAPLPDCPAPGGSMAGSWQSRESSLPGVTIDACGRPHFSGGLRAIPLSGSQPVDGARASASAPGATIDSMSVGWSDNYSPWAGLTLMVFAQRYYLSDGSSWTSGAGSALMSRARFHHVEISGDTLRYVLIPPSDSTLYSQTDYNSGVHSAHGTLKVVGPLVLVAQAGSSTAWLHGNALIASNDVPPNSGAQFNFYSTIPGAVVPFVLRYSLSYGTWSDSTLETSFSFGNAGIVDFSRPVSTPALTSLAVAGPSQVPDGSTMQYVAMASYEGGIQRDVSARATWTVEPSALASIQAGQLVTRALSTPQATLTVTAHYEFGGVAREGQLSVLCRRDLLSAPPTAWPTYQANARHDGHLPLMLNPAEFAKAWSVTLRSGTPLNPVTASDGHVFCSSVIYFGGGDSFFALDARDGHTMWSKAYGAFSVNPPACAYGNVYLQTCDNWGDTWLHAYDVATGNRLYDAPFGAQWERYYSPTPFAGNLYFDGGSYGGMYAFNALTGAQLWYLGLPQYDEWTPSVDSTYVYAYVGDYNPGLYVARRADAAQAFMIPDPSFRWDGWSMNGVAVLGAHGDAIATHDGRLIRFDLAGRVIAWQRSSGYAGQPAVAHDAIYVVRSGALAVLDEVSGADLWTWRPGTGALQGPVLVTDSHAFVSGADSVFAVDLDAHRRVWAYPASGWLAMANGQLYVAGNTGLLTAITVGGKTAAVTHANAGRDTTLECADVEGRGTPVMLDGRSSTGDDLVYQWSAPGVTFDDPSSPRPTGWFRAGKTIVSLTVNGAGGTSADTVYVTLRDTRPPSLAISLGIARVRPGHGVQGPPDESGWLPVHATVVAADGCDPAPGLVLTSVQRLGAHRSIDTDQPLTTTDGDGNHADVSDADIGTADFDFFVWSPGLSSRRTYSVCYSATDAAGHEADLCDTLVVPGPGSTPWTDPLAPDAGLARAGGSTKSGSSPIEFAIRATPNPAPGRVQFLYALPIAGRVRLRVFDVAGRQVSTPVDEWMGVGAHIATFGAGREGALGLYFYELEWAGRSASGRFVLAR